MKQIYTLLTLIFWSSIAVHAQLCSVPQAGKPQMGAMIEPQFANLWKQASVNDKHGAYFKTGAASIADDGWTIDGVNHNFRFYFESIQPRLKNGDIIKVKFKGTVAQVGSAVEACSVQNILFDNVYTWFEVKITNDGNGNGFVFQLKERCTDIQIMRPGYNFGDTRLLTDEYVQHISQWSTLRYTNLLSSNTNFGQTWGKRVSPNAPCYINNFEWSAPDCNSTNSAYSRFSEDITPAIAGSGKGSWSPGAPWETMIDISNYANKDMWINIPVMADDNYVLQLSKLIKQRLKPTLSVHVEIGTELWNFSPPYMGFNMLRQVLADEWAQKDPEKLKILGGPYCQGCELEGGASTNRTACNYSDWTAMQRWMARRLKEMMEQFALDWGWKANGGVGSRIKATLAGQLGYAYGGHAWNIGAGLDFLSRAYGPEAPSKYLYSVSIAPFFASIEPESRFTPNLAVSQIIQNYSTHSQNYHFGEFSEETIGQNILTGNKLEGVMGKAKMNGLTMFAYEGGNEIGNAGVGGAWRNYDSVSTVIKDPRFGIANTNLLKEWYSWFGGDALFIKNGDYTGSVGAYSMSENLNENNALRLSYINLSSDTTTLFTSKRGGTIGNTKVATLDARKYAGYNSDWNSGITIIYETKANADFTEASTGFSMRPFIIRNEKSGIYKFSLERLPLQGLEYDRQHPIICDIYLNEKVIHKGVNLSIETTLTNGLGWTSPISLEIPYGIHALRVRPVLPSVDKQGNYTNLINRIQISQYKFELDAGCDVILSSNDVQTTESFFLFPNPTQNGAVTLKFDLDEQVQNCYLLDVQGRKIKSFVNIVNEGQIDISDLADGCYQLVINTEKNRIVKRLVKIK